MVPADADDAPLPREMGRYEILGRLAMGGMAEVLLARAKGLGGFEKLFVIKRMRRELSKSPELSRQIVDEARIVATLVHGNLVQVFDVDTDADGTVYLVLEYLHGVDLAAVVERANGGAGLSWDHAIAIAMGVCAGLHYAHEKRDDAGRPLGIVHRDVSPQNVLVTFDGGVKVIDFGIAKATTTMSKTLFGMVKGKPGYMSPEQCEGDKLDRRSDVFGAAVLLYLLTTGRPPFPVEPPEAYFDAVLEGRPAPPSSLRADYPTELERIVMKGLARKRDDRYATTQEMARDLDAFAEAHKLSLSPTALAKALETWFPDRLTTWRAVQEGSVGIADYVRQTRELGAATKAGRHGATARLAAPSLAEPATTPWNRSAGAVPEAARADVPGASQPSPSERAAASEPQAPAEPRASSRRGLAVAVVGAVVVAVAVAWSATRDAALPTRTTTAATTAATAGATSAETATSVDRAPAAAAEPTTTGPRASAEASRPATPGNENRPVSSDARSPRTAPPATAKPSTGADLDAPLPR